VYPKHAGMYAFDICKNITVLKILAESPYLAKFGNQVANFFQFDS